MAGSQRLPETDRAARWASFGVERRLRWPPDWPSCLQAAAGAEAGALPAGPAAPARGAHEDHGQRGHLLHAPHAVHLHLQVGGAQAPPSGSTDTDAKASGVRGGGGSLLCEVRKCKPRGWCQAFSGCCLAPCVCPSRPLGTVWKSEHLTGH